eukprot:TRINITY_DN1992_c0_g1_i2.p1 TRINITY_DN1992_c0_g1~~TRINITY_DN1992_c0_g1_i2.p1  ORF type:complete len:395 (-),score=55.80 TRINITY_DN1992_c0_g1_i2:2665-3849(-)
MGACLSTGSGKEQPNAEMQQRNDSGSRRGGPSQHNRRTATAAAAAAQLIASVPTCAPSGPTRIHTVPHAEAPRGGWIQPKSFTYAELKAATKNFKPELLVGEGGFGRVYKGCLMLLEEGGEGGKGSLTEVAVKVLNTEGLQGHREFMAEVNFLGHLRHKHLVRLIGYCQEDEERLLVYEYLTKGSLENHLFSNPLQPPALSWNARMKIALGAARGLMYLHEEAERSVIYRDFKTSNILLKEDFTCKLSDFGLAKDGPVGDNTHVSTRVMGTYGYAAPEYVMTGHLTSRSDVYSFGVVLLELMTGRRSMDKSRPMAEQSLVTWARDKGLHNKSRLYRIMDPRLEGEYSVRASWMVASLALSCLNRDPKQRPRMVGCVAVLKQCQNATDLVNQGGL